MLYVILMSIKNKTNILWFNLQLGQYSSIIDRRMAGKRRIIKGLGGSGWGLEAQSRYLPGTTSENWENSIKIVQRPGRNSQRTPSEFTCIVLLLHLPNTYADLCCCTYRIHMQSFTTTTTVFICRTLLLHLPNTYAEFCYWTYRIHTQTFAAAPTEYICRALLLQLPCPYAELN